MEKERFKMTKNMEMKIAAMHELEEELLKGGHWEDLCGYSLNDELLQFMNLTEELKIG
jgi:hypothetical protein